MTTPIELKSAKKSFKRDGGSSLTYLGVKAETPPNITWFNKDPKTTDYKSFVPGDFWGNFLTKDIFVMVSKEANIGIWVRSVFDVVGGKNINTSIPVLPNTIQVNLDQGTAKGQVLIMNTATGVAEWNTLDEGANVSIVNDDGSITISADGGTGGDITLDGDSGTATTNAGKVQVVGTAGRITTTGDNGDTLTIDVGAKVAVSFKTTSGADAEPAVGVLTVVGSKGLATSSAGSTVTVAGYTAANGQNTNTNITGSTLTTNVNNTHNVAVAAASLQIGTVDSTQKLGSVTIAALKVLLGLP